MKDYIDRRASLSDGCEPSQGIERCDPRTGKGVARFDCVTLRERPELMRRAAAWFHEKWGVPEAAYIQHMSAYVHGETENAWALCLDGDRIVGGLGVVDNDFHDRPDLSPNICAVYTEEDCRGRGIAGRLLERMVEVMRSAGVSPVYLVTDHVGFYERYGWEFMGMVREEGGAALTRMYIHR